MAVLMPGFWVSCPVLLHIIINLLILAIGWAWLLVCAMGLFSFFSEIADSLGPSVNTACVELRNTRRQFSASDAVDFERVSNLFIAPYMYEGGGRYGDSFRVMHHAIAAELLAQAKLDKIPAYTLQPERRLPVTYDTATTGLAAIGNAALRNVGSTGITFTNCFGLHYRLTDVIDGIANYCQTVTAQSEGTRGRYAAAARCILLRTPEGRQSLRECFMPSHILDHSFASISTLHPVLPALTPAYDTFMGQLGLTAQPVRPSSDLGKRQP
jgi:hypothetical protein